MKKVTKKLVSVFLSLLLLSSVFILTIPSAEAQTGTKSYDITNPYEDVDFNSWGAYKAQLHVQSIASDGNVQLKDVVEKHYSLGYDILCITDHSCVGKGWTVAPQTVPLFRFIKRERTGMSEVIPLSEERAAEIKSGVGRGGRGMLEVKQGVEMNSATPSNCHLNGFFADYGQASFGMEADYETPIRMNAKFGGITFLDHLGCYTKANDGKGASVSSDPAIVNKFAKIFIDNPTCVGTDISSGSDDDTKYDRILYDNILQKTIPYGVTPWAFTFSDGHQINEFDRAFTVHMMPELTVDALRTSMENGTFFSLQRHARVELGETFEGDENISPPLPSNVIVNAAENTITITPDANTTSIKWISNGEIIAAGINTVDINDFEDKITSYLRVNLEGPGGICYTQPFTVIESGTELVKEEIPETKDISSWLRPLIDFIDWNLFRNNPLMNLFKKYAMGLTEEQIDRHYATHFEK